MKTAPALLCVISLAACHKRIGVHPGPAAGRSVHVAWTASTTAGVMYNVYRKSEACTGTAAFTKITASPIAAVFYDDLNVAEGTYCYYATSYLATASPAESVASNKDEALVQAIQPQPPTQLNVTPAAVTVNIGGQQQFQAMRGPDTVRASWSINPPEGTIDAAGLYRAPDSIKGNNVKIQVLARESNESATADITVRK